jgi:histidinol dehydrogenase
MEPGTHNPATSLEIPRPLRLGELHDEHRQRILERTSQSDPLLDDRIIEQAYQIVKDIIKRQDEALLEHTKRLDGVTPEPLMLGKNDFDAACKKIPEKLLKSLQRAADNLRTLAERTRPHPSPSVEIEPGLIIEERLDPLKRVGAYAPGGRAAYPSSVLMTVVPARAAGVEEVIVASPPGPDGRPHNVVLAACAVAGATACLAAGGAQAIAALAHGTKQVPRVDKIVGPGNPWVNAAKRIVHGRVDTDSPAGPSEVIVLADATADPKWVAMDLIAQAEHGPDSPCLLVTPDKGLAQAVADALPGLIEEAERAETIRTALAGHGALLVASDMDEAVDFVNEYAPEHLEIITQDTKDTAARVRTAGTIFLGPWAPVPAGDYLTGANHVLPTGGAGRYSGPLSVHDFLVRRTHQHIDQNAARALIEDLDTLAIAEGLPAHGDAMRLRTRNPVPYDAQAETPDREEDTP